MIGHPLERCWERFIREFIGGFDDMPSTCCIWEAVTEAGANMFWPSAWITIMEQTCWVQSMNLRGSKSSRSLELWCRINRWDDAPVSSSSCVCCRCMLSLTSSGQAYACAMYGTRFTEGQHDQGQFGRQHSEKAWPVMCCTCSSYRLTCCYW
jgi:hypothetical protein